MAGVFFAVYPFDRGVRERKTRIGPEEKMGTSSCEEDGVGHLNMGIVLLYILPLFRR